MKWIADKDAQHLISRFPEGQAWIDALPERIKALAEQWGLTELEAKSAGLAGVVIACQREEVPCVLKLAVEEDKLQRERKALSFWAGPYVPAVYEYSGDAYLMEHIFPGTD